MKKVYHLLFSLLVVLIVSSCSSGNKAYKKGDYFKACQESIDRLRSNPKNEKAAYVLTSSYPLAQQTAERTIQNAELANQIDKYDVIVYQYERLNQLANDIYRCPKALELIPRPKEYVTELGAVKKLAAEQSYNLGLRALDDNTMDQARVAYQYFQNANRYVPGYKDVLRKLEDARKVAS